MVNLKVSILYVTSFSNVPSLFANQAPFLVSSSNFRFGFVVSLNVYLAKSLDIDYVATVKFNL